MPKIIGVKEMRTGRDRPVAAGKELQPFTSIEDGIDDCIRNFYRKQEAE